MSSQSPSPGQSKTRSRGGRRSRRNGSRVPALPEKSEYGSADDDYQSPPPPPPQRRQQLQSPQQQSQPLGGLPVIGNGGVGDVLPVGNVGQTANNLVNGATGTLDNVAGGVLNGGGGAKNDTLKLRLDLNLEVEVTLKARIHGDLTLALLRIQALKALLEGTNTEKQMPARDKKDRIMEDNEEKKEPGTHGVFFLAVMLFVGIFAVCILHAGIVVYSLGVTFWRSIKDTNFIRNLRFRRYAETPAMMGQVEGVESRRASIV
ncbi:hypothetical protein F4861DRAFT_545352 [Xylaria intraflava]|nr:hypothetical protein F4861DRAFT_545352 [Xylaria intraflava]